ncbi:WXG100-like domain-containing protein, partial [Nocardia salmonicida]
MAIPDAIAKSDLKIPEDLQFLSYLAGGAWPQGSENGMFALADVWSGSAAELTDLVESLSDVIDDIIASYSSAKGGSMAKTLESLIDESDTSSLQAIAASMNNVAATCDKVGCAIQENKIMIIAGLVQLVVEIAIAWFFPPTAPAVQTAAMTFWQLVFAWLKRMLLEVIQAALNAMLQQVILDLLIQLGQMAADHRDGVDWNAVGQFALGGALGGAFGALFGQATGDLIKHGGAKITGTEFNKTWQQVLQLGGQGIGGGFGGMVGGGVAKQILEGGPFTLDPRMLGAGAGGALSGGIRGLRSGGGNVHVDVNVGVHDGGSTPPPRTDGVGPKPGSVPSGDGATPSKSSADGAVPNPNTANKDATDSGRSGADDVATTGDRSVGHDGTDTTSSTNPRDTTHDSAASTRTDGSRDTSEGSSNRAGAHDGDAPSATTPKTDAPVSDSVVSQPARPSGHQEQLSRPTGDNASQSPAKPPSTSERSVTQPSSPRSQGSETRMTRPDPELTRATPQSQARDSASTTHESAVSVGHRSEEVAPVSRGTDDSASVPSRVEVESVNSHRDGAEPVVHNRPESDIGAGSKAQGDKSTESSDAGERARSNSGTHDPVTGNRWRLVDSALLGPTWPGFKQFARGVIGFQQIWEALHGNKSPHDGREPFRQYRDGDQPLRPLFGQEKPSTPPAEGAGEVRGRDKALSRGVFRFNTDEMSDYRYKLDTENNTWSKDGTQPASKAAESAKEASKASDAEGRGRA